MRRFDPALFQEIPWGTDRVFEETLKRVHPHQDRIGILGRWYDVDTVSDLRRLRAHLTQMAEGGEGGIPLRTCQVLSELVF